MTRIVISNFDSGVALFSRLLSNLIITSGHFKLIQLQSSLLHKFIFSPLRDSSLKFLFESFRDPNSPLNQKVGDEEVFPDSAKELLLRALAKTEPPRLFKMLIKDFAEIMNGLQTLDALGNYL